MKKALWALLAFVAAAFPGAARASDIVVTDTLTGIVIGGDDSVGAFGGGNLAGDVVTYSFTADLTLLNSNAYHATDNSSYESLTDYAAEGSISESVTINGGTYSMTSTASPDLGELFFGGGGDLLPGN